MKRIVLVLIVFASLANVSAQIKVNSLGIVEIGNKLDVAGQEFSFSMYFEDAVGNKDTLVLGYDPAATNGINLQFGEENICYEPFIKDLDVRTGIIKEYYWHPDTFLTKKHIMPKTCNIAVYPPPGYIYIYCKHFPLKISWDPVFNNDCNKYSFITDWYPGSWFDAAAGGEQGPFFMKDSASVTFSHLNIYGGVEDLLSYNGAKLNMLYYSLWYSPNLSSTRKILPEKLVIYPNPVKDILYIQTGNSEFEFAKIRDLTGRIILFSSNNPIQVSSLPKGTYLLELTIKNSQNVLIHKFIK